MKIEHDTWDRREIFDFFSGMKDPFYMVTFTVDVTPLYRYVKAKGLSCYYAMVWCCMKAVNAVENFRYVIRDGEVHLIDGRSPSFTDLKPGSELFHIVTIPMVDDPEVFCRRAAERSRSQTCFINTETETDDLVYLSCLPWLDLTALTNERDPDRDDTVPRVSWGKYAETDGRKQLNLSLEVNHRFIDGIHIGKFQDALLQEMQALEQSCG